MAGRPKPAPGHESKLFSISAPAAWIDRVRAAAHEDGRDISSFVRRAVDHYLATKEDK